MNNVVEVVTKTKTVIKSSTVTKIGVAALVVSAALGIIVSNFALASVKLDPGNAGFFSMAAGRCISDWQCSEWSQCSNGTQNRNCVDLNSCKKPKNKPAESQSCSNESIIYVDGQNVRGTCNDTITNEENSLATPYCTITRAVQDIAPGDAVYVSQGIYREEISLAGISGTPGEYITIKAFPGDDVIVSGANQLANWVKCTVDTCPGNPNFNNIWYADHTRIPIILAENGEVFDYSRAPDTGWWGVEGGSNTVIIDSQHLCTDCLLGITQADDYWINGRISKYLRNGRTTGSRIISDSTNNQITFSNISTPDAANDLYFLENTLEILNEPGEWFFDRQPAKPHQIYIWPKNGDPNNNLIEVGYRSFGFDLADAKYVSIEDFEIRYAQKRGIGTVTAAEGIKIINNNIHDNFKGGILLTGSTGTLIQDNKVSNNYGNGIVGGYNSNIDGNEIIGNWVDGITEIYGGTIINNNIIKNHMLNAHPDGIQAIASSSKNNDIWITNNTLINNWQTIVIADSDNGHLIGNVIIGGRIPLVNGTANNWEIKNNTFIPTGAPELNVHNAINFHPDGQNYIIENNIFYLASVAGAFVINTPNLGFSSDNNIFYKPSDATNRIIEFSNVDYGGDAVSTFADYQLASGLDANSKLDDPKFRNAPKCIEQAFTQITSTNDAHYTGTKLYLKNDYADCFGVDDNIEVQFDGVVRKVTSTGSDEHGSYIELSQKVPQEYFGLRDMVLFNWKSSTNFNLDLKPDRKSPACGKGRGSYIGAIKC